MVVPAQTETEQLTIRPYARLLTMLGEQLIKNERVALVELLKNSYDADATMAKVIFAGFGDGLRVQPSSALILVDDGDGMSEDVVRDHWLNPATAVKAHIKANELRTAKNRSIQGEKGIGRFAMFKLGSAATIITRAREADYELVVDYDLAFLDDDLQMTQPGVSRFLDQVGVQFRRREPEIFEGSSGAGNQSVHGTRIEIRNLRSSWSMRAATRVFEDVLRLQPLVPARDFEPPEAGSEFRVEFWDDDDELPFRTDFERRLTLLFDERAVLSVDGLVDGAKGELLLEFDEKVESFGIHDPALAGLNVHKKYFGERQRARDSDSLACGSFSFSFYIFDLSATSPSEYRLDADDKALVKNHRIYLYRDGVRVLPYGDPEDDWLQLDVLRGTQGASRVLGNDQTVGFVHISHALNPQLRDKTNREGLLDEGDAYGDFVAILQTIAAYIRTKPYARYVQSKRRKAEAASRQGTDITSALKELEETPNLPSGVKAAVSEIEKSYVAEHEFLKTRVERTEDLAGVGLSVETASHDILAAGGRALQVARSIVSYVEESMPSNSYLRGRLNTLVELLVFVSARLNDVQGLFVSTRQRRKAIDAGDFAERVARMFRFALEESAIELQISQPDGPLAVKSTEGALLQTLVNLIDNAIYWVSVGVSNPKIVVQVDAPSNRVIVADNGPGVDLDDEPYIFEPFYSGKGVDGKGLGLYIARQVGLRNGFTVTLSRRLEILPGANFVISFAEDQT